MASRGGARSRGAVAGWGRGGTISVGGARADGDAQSPGGAKVSRRRGSPGAHGHPTFVLVPSGPPPLIPPALKGRHSPSPPPDPDVPAPRSSVPQSSHRTARGTPPRHLLRFGLEATTSAAAGQVLTPPCPGSGTWCSTGSGACRLWRAGTGVAPCASSRASPGRPRKCASTWAACTCWPGTQRPRCG